MTQARDDTEAVQALATAAGLDITHARARHLRDDAEHLLGLYRRLLRTAPGEAPPAAVFRVERRRRDR